MTQTLSEKRKAWRTAQSERSATIPCACGCGTPIKEIVNGRKRRFVSGHNGQAWKKWGNRAELKREWNHRNRPARYKARVRHFRVKKVRLLGLFGSKCLDCGLEYNGKNACVFHFHHRDPSSKMFAVGNQLCNKSWSTVVKEAQKCDLICANCHEMRHSGEF